MRKLTTEEKFEMQLNHPFYKEVDKEGERIKREQLYKAANKYDKPFNPNDWTAEQLKDHFLQENYDQKVYGVALAWKLEEYEDKLKALEEENEDLKNELKEMSERVHDLKFENRNLEDKVEELEDTIEELEG
ncbi:unnamed protein product [Bacillus phage SPP1]|nr:hypothetical protein SPP1p091 [Bacillus phage SPP1]CAA66501.1 unnamed protein product [Bacillus phage SPP1]